MKKYLALAILASCFNYAHAQSRVSIYGILDTGISIGKGSNGSKTTMMSGGYVPPRLGFSGSEDIGNGTSINFALEGQMNTATGAGSNTNSNNLPSGNVVGGFNFNRQSWLSIRSQKYGELRAGRAINPTFMMYVYFDPFNGGSIGASQAAMGSLAGYADSGGVRNSSSLDYFSPNMGGIRFHGALAKGNSTQPGDAKRDGDYAGFNIRYQQDRLHVGAAYAIYKRSSKDDIKEFVTGARYDLRPISLFAHYTKAKSGILGESSGFMLASTYNLAAYEARLTYSESRRKNISGASIGKTQKIAISGAYKFSKRTLAYLSIAVNKNKDGANAIPWFGLADNGPNGTSRVIGLGITHTF